MNKHILFRVGEQIFAIPISSTDRVIHIENLTVVPDMSASVIGIQDVEGVITPLIDMAQRFYGIKIENLDRSDTIIVNWKGEKIGLAVNEVLSVETYYETQVSKDRKQLDKMDGLATSYISNFVQTDTGIIPILDTNLLFNAEQAEEIRALLEIDSIQH